MTLHNVIIAILAIGFAFMGFVALLTPGRVVEQFDISQLSAAGRSEVRAVYGGFGLAMAGLLVVALTVPDLRSGICLSLAVALFGMAGGRVASLLVDRTMPRLPALYFIIECGGATALLYARTVA